MNKLSDNDIHRQDFVDNSIFNLFNELNPTSQIIEWNIEMIGDIREAITTWFANRLKLCTERDFYPFNEV